MASLRNVNKSFQRLHRERHQPAARAHLGYLEKEKDYKARAEDFQRKQNAIRKLRKKALDKNPDEFHFHMVNSQLVDGKHFEKDNPDEFTAEQLLVLQTQDIRFVGHRRNIERNKIEKLRASLHLIGVDRQARNRHIFFTDTRQQAQSADLAHRLGTAPELIATGASSSFNLPQLDTLAKGRLDYEPEQAAELDRRRDQMYNELMKRVAREKQLSIILQKMSAKANLMKTKDKSTVTKVKDGDASAAPVYKWKKERKR